MIGLRLFPKAGGVDNLKAAIEPRPHHPHLPAFALAAFAVQQTAFQHGSRRDDPPVVHQEVNE